MNAREKAISQISDKLNEILLSAGTLNDDNITDQVEQFKKIYDLIEYRKFLFGTTEKALTDEMFIEITRELKEKFNTRMDRAFILQGKHQQNRDTSWWTSKIKPKNDNYYWNRYEKLFLKDFTGTIVKGFDDDSDDVVNNIGDPNNDEFGVYGMVVGHVQSGKTNSYSSVICKAADAGYKVIIVIAGGLDNLRNQTQIRLNEAFIGFSQGNYVGVGLIDHDSTKMPICLTTEKTDFNKRDADNLSSGITLDNTSSPIILVIKKNTSTLKNVHKWLKSHYKNGVNKHAMLLIDDESDYASINYKDESDPTKINKGIRDLLALFKKRTYIAYTATPFANIFIDHEANNLQQGEDLFPNDFICTLDPPSIYQGARKLFLEKKEDHIIEIDDNESVFPINHKKDLIVNNLPESLNEAIYHFLLIIATRERRGQKNKHNSMLVHTTRFTDVHIQVAYLISNKLDEIKRDLQNFGMLTDATKHSNHIEQLYLVYKKYISIIDWSVTLRELVDIIHTVVVREVHQKTKIRLEYRNDVNTNAIVVGGTSLSRGYTLQGLSISYFLRNTLFYDTLMQMARWFGYRPGYNDLCKVYLPDNIATNFGVIIEIIEELYDRFKSMHKMRKTPEEYGLFVRRHPDSALQITAKNKMKNVRNVVIEMNLEGSLKESAWLPKDENKRQSNYNLVVNLINYLSKNAEYSEKRNPNHLWFNLSKEYVLSFLEKFSVYSSDPYGLKSRMPIEFIKQFILTDPRKWDVALYNGSGYEHYICDYKINLEERIAFDKGEYIEINRRRISSGNVGAAESIVLENPPKHYIEIRNMMTKPLIMIHMLKLKGDGFSNEPYPAIGICIPGDATTGSKIVSISANTVWNLDFDNDEVESDD